jgi:tetratricopeptide (TPR) repeat protein
MNAQPQLSSVDDRNPWLGLASFTEETRQFFYGREDEVAELSRRVQRKLLTVLFGQSGLGKTSILRAGLVPRLRAQGYCPVYVRIDYGRAAPEPAEQIKQAIADTARGSGQWTQVGVAAPGESLWEFLHHRDDVLRDSSGTTLVPLLIFDQFEEIFTLAQSDDFGRERAARFIAELSDLVENRPPKALEARLEVDDTAADRFDFGRSDYRVVIALREDYLAPLEGLKTAMPSITQNRLRLAPMTGQQALAAVLQPGKGLVTEEVAAAIVRFVAGGGEIANAEVEPSLLSLICRELNDARISQGRSDISLDLLAGSHATILSNFYERSLADQPAAVRQIIEEQLLTASGYRENIAEERVLSAFAAAGAAPDTLAVLVNRRLLRIEERLDVRRVELTHDVLCGVVKASRDARHEREARAATETLLADQRERELAARRALVRARQVASICGVLALGAIIAAVLAIVSTQRARRAERQAQQTRNIAEQGREQAENLLGYLTNDFANKLETFGRLDVASEFAKRQIDYFHALPADLKDTQSIRNGAIAMVFYGRATRQLGNIKAANTTIDESIGLLQQLRSGGDKAESTTIGLAQALSVKAAIYDNQNDPQGTVVGTQGLDLLQPLADAPGASADVKRAYTEALIRVGWENANANNHEAAIKHLRRAMQLAVELGARDPKNIEMQALYAEGGAWISESLLLTGHMEEGRQIGEESLGMTDRVLALRPGYRLTLHSQQVLEEALSDIANSSLDPAEALKMGLRGTATSETMLRLDPGNVVTLNNIGVNEQAVGNAIWAAGRVHESIPYYVKAADSVELAIPGGTGFAMVANYFRAGAVVSQAEVGDFAGAEAQLARATKIWTALYKSEAATSVEPILAEAISRGAEATLALEHGDPAGARRITTQVIQRVEALKPEPGNQEFQKFATLNWAYNFAGQAEYQLGDFAAAEHSIRLGIDARQKWPAQSTSDQRDLANLQIWLALTLARQGHSAEALKVLQPILKFQRELAARNHGDRWQPVELASALYAEALADKTHSADNLREAATLLDAVPAELRSMRMVRQWRDGVRKAMQTPPA